MIPLGPWIRSLEGEGRYRVVNAHVEVILYSLHRLLEYTALVLSEKDPAPAVFK